MIVVTTERPVDLRVGSDVAVARTLTDLHRPVGLLAVPGRTAVLPTLAEVDPVDEWNELDMVALHAGAPVFGAHAATLEGLFVRERARAEMTISLDLHAQFPVWSSRARLQRQIRRAHIVTATADVLARLYPGLPAAAIAMGWREAGVACGAIVSDRDGVLLLAPNGLSYRRVMPGASFADPAGAGAAFTAGLLDELATLGALGSDPAARLADVGPQQWLSVLEHADTVARSHAADPSLALALSS